MLVVHHLNNSRSQRVLWLLEELELPYELRVYPRDPRTMLAPPALRQVHPLGKSPVVTDGDTVLAESGAILETLAERHGQGRLLAPPGSADALRQRYFLHYAEGSLMPYLLMKLVFDEVRRKTPFLVRPFAAAIAAGVHQSFTNPNLRTHLDFLEAELAERPWFAGAELTIADIQLSFPLEAAEARAGLDASRPRLMDFLARVRARPAYQRALQKGGPLAL